MIKVIDGWYVENGRIINSVGRAIPYESNERVDNGLKVKTEFDDTVYLFNDDTNVYNFDKKIGEYLIIKGKDKYRIGKNNKFSDWYNNINLKEENGIVYGIIEKEGKWALLKFNGEEEISGWYDNILNLEISNGLIYAKVEKNEKWALLKFNGEEEISGWYDNISYSNVENETSYSVVRKGNKKAIIKFDGKNEILSNWHDDILCLGTKKEIIYAEVKDGNKYFIIKFNKKENTISGSYHNIDDWNIEREFIYLKADNRGISIPIN